MSQENVEVVREAMDAVNARDPDAFITCLHPEVEWVDSGDPLPGLRGVYRKLAESRLDRAMPISAHSLRMGLQAWPAPKPGAYWSTHTGATR